MSLVVISLCRPQFLSPMFKESFRAHLLSPIAVSDWKSLSLTPLHFLNFPNYSCTMHAVQPALGHKLHKQLTTHINTAAAPVYIFVGCRTEVQCLNERTLVIDVYDLLISSECNT